MSAKPAVAAANVIEVERVLGETATRQRGSPSEPRTA